ncbi:MAG: hypothetical protein PUG33_03065 [Mollicutes bacterium]|nr:hypothetical protein [Mollicutes bacterium]
MYGIVSIIGSILRQVYLPNPFVNIFTSQGIADLFNLVIGGAIIGGLSYFLTGCVYERGEAPAVGSFLYTFNYALITFSFYGISLIIKNIIIATIVYMFLYIIVCIFLSNLRNKQYNF